MYIQSHYIHYACRIVLKRGRDLGESVDIIAVLELTQYAVYVACTRSIMILKCFLLCSCCRTPTGRGGPRAQARARARARAPREGRAPRYQQHTSCVLLRTHSASKSRIARAKQKALRLR